MSIYKFSPAAEVPDTCPESEALAYYKKLQDSFGKRPLLPRKDADRLAQIMYGLTSQHSVSYRYAGWVLNFSEVLREFVVESRFDATWRSFYAADKTALRKVLTGIRRIVEVTGSKP